MGKSRVAQITAYYAGSDTGEEKRSGVDDDAERPDIALRRDPCSLTLANRTHRDKLWCV